MEISYYQVPSEGRESTSLRCTRRVETLLLAAECLRVSVRYMQSLQRKEEQEETQKAYAESS